MSTTLCCGSGKAPRRAALARRGRRGPRASRPPNGLQRGLGGLGGRLGGLGCILGFLLCIVKFVLGIAQRFFSFFVFLLHTALQRLELINHVLHHAIYILYGRIGARRGGHAGVEDVVIHRGAK